MNELEEQIRKYEEVLAKREREIAELKKQFKETVEVASWAQAVLTALNVGDVKSGSPLHLKLREVMIAYRAGTLQERLRDQSNIDEARGYV